jgi:phenylacetate-CoA ligase
MELFSLVSPLYERLPHPLRSVAATWRGMWLYRWRYGAETERMVEEALERETWTPTQWKTWQEAALASLLDRAAKEVPFYREYWTLQRRRGNRASWEILENWPILEKEHLRKNPLAFLADDRSRTWMLHLHTSGTTGTPLELWQSRDTVRQWYALFETRWRRWYGVSMHDRYGMLGGRLVTPVGQRRPPFWVWNQAFRQLYCSSYHLAPDLIPHYLDALARYRVTYLCGYTSSIYLLAEEVLRLGRTDLGMKVVVLNAEPVYDSHRRVIEKAFRCPARETYGMTEKVMGASECEHGALHLWPEAGVVEVLGEDGASTAGFGDLILTGLLQRDMPLIRYRIGDRGALQSISSCCSCGRTLPILQSVDGRSDDVLVTQDGRQIGRLDPVFKADLPVREVQVIQEALDRLLVRIVPAEGFTGADEAVIRARLQDRLGKIHIDIEFSERLPRSSGGKIRAVVCQIPNSSRPALRDGTTY